jgi:phosphoribosylformylglycinamidine (FGAM) synthase-like enzyme
MDLKSPGNLLYLVGLTKRELAGSHWHLITPSDRHDLASGRHDLASGRRDVASGRRDLASGRREPAVTNGEQETGDRRQEAGDRVQGSGFEVQVPTVDAPQAKQTFHAVHAAIQRGLVRACHDLSEGGLAVAAAEMCFAGGLGAEIELAAVPRGNESDDASVLLFSESNSRFLCEVPSDASAAFEGTLADVPCAKIGTVSDAARLCILGPTGGAVVDSEVETLKQAWKRPLAW